MEPSRRLSQLHSFNRMGNAEFNNGRTTQDQAALSKEANIRGSCHLDLPYRVVTTKLFCQASPRPHPSFTRVSWLRATGPLVSKIRDTQGPRPIRYSSQWIDRRDSLAQGFFQQPGSSSGQPIQNLLKPTQLGHLDNENGRQRSLDCAHFCIVSPPNSTVRLPCTGITRCNHVGVASLRHLTAIAHAGSQHDMRRAC